MASSEPFTGENLLDVLNSFENVALDLYVAIRRGFNIDHAMAKRFMTYRSTKITDYEKGIELGVSLEQMDELGQQGFLIPNVLYILKSCEGSTLDEAIKAQEVRRLHTYVELRTVRRVEHERIIEVARAAREADCFVEDVFEMVFTYDIKLAEAIEAAATHVYHRDYVAAIRFGVTHQDIIEAATIDFAGFHNYMRVRYGKGDHESALRYLREAMKSRI